MHDELFGIGDGDGDGDGASIKLQLKCGGYNLLIDV
jgi:hypothetical protein